MNRLILTSLVTLLLVSSCKNEDVVANDIENSNVVKLKDQRSDFVWRAMNLWYNWQENVPLLSDKKFKNTSELNTFLNGYTSSEEVFYKMLYRYKEVDRFSWYIKDYEEQAKSFQGINTSFGLDFNLSLRTEQSDDVVMYITHVTPGSPADQAGLKRGDVINAIGGVKMTRGNFKVALQNYYKESTSFTVVEKDGTTVVEIKEINKAVVKDDPVYFHKVIENRDGRKIAYLVYNGFRATYNEALNNVFGEFKSAGVQELILDLRLNGGGSVETCTYLASMITDASGIFSQIKYNNKITGINSDINSKNEFTDKMNTYKFENNKIVIDKKDILVNRLSGLNRVYIITSDNTASASEMIINGLIPYFGNSNVITIGTKTRGKNVGSNTLYDSPKKYYLSQADANSNHKIALQPITFQIYNRDNQSDYINGFEPKIKVEEQWDNIKAFGDEDERLLKIAIAHINGLSARLHSSYNRVSKNIDFNRTDEKFRYEMYLDPHLMNNKKF